MTMQGRLGLLVLGLLPMACGPDPKGTPTPSGATAKDEAKGAAAEGPGDVGDEPLRNGKPSLEALGQAIVEGLNARDGRALNGLAVPEVEYVKRLFAAVESEPTTLAQGPIRGWTTHDRLSRAGLAAALREHGGKDYVFVSLEPAGRQERRGLVIYGKPRLTVENSQGLSLELPIVGAVVEHSGSHTVSILSFQP